MSALREHSFERPENALWLDVLKGVHFSAFVDEELIKPSSLDGVLEALVDVPNVWGKTGHQHLDPRTYRTITARMNRYGREATATIWLRGSGTYVCDLLHNGADWEASGFRLQFVD